MCHSSLRCHSSLSSAVLAAAGRNFHETVEGIKRLTAATLAREQPNPYKTRHTILLIGRILP
jgi:hypothetical protein